MAASRETQAPPDAAPAFDYDAIIIGAGMSGMYQLYRLRERGMRVRVFEAGTGVGGTWYWNRYPGARFDSESYSYGYSFSKELLEEWSGSNGVPTTQTIAKSVGHLTVFQRTPNWCAPLHNSKIDAETQREIKSGYPEMFRRCQETFACFLHTPDPRGTFEVSDEEREAFFEKLYAERGFGIWQGNFRDILVDRKANAVISDFVARKIRQRVNDQQVAEKLIPKNHGFGTRRLTLETFYYEVYNRDNVELVDITETLIERIPTDGIKTSDRKYEFDIIIYATGFDAITGSFDRIDFRGVDGARLKDRWKSGPQTFLGALGDGFPNMMMLMGPHTALVYIPRSIQYNC